MKKLKLYLPFEIDFINNDMHSELIERYGAHGLGIYFMVLMELRNHEGYRCGLSTIKGAARRCLADPEMLESVLEDFQLFEFNECGDRTMISSIYIDRVMQPFEEKKRSFSSTASENTLTVERAVYGMSTVTHREIINKIEIKTKIKTTTSTTNKKAATAANVAVAAADVVNDVNPKTATWQPTKAWVRYLEKSTAGESRIEPLPNFMWQGTSHRKHTVGLPRQHDTQSEKRSPYRFETVNPVTGGRSYFGGIISRGSPPRLDNDVMCGQVGLGNGFRGLSNAGCTPVRCNRHLLQMLPAFGVNATGIWFK